MCLFFLHDEHTFDRVVEWEALGSGLDTTSYQKVTKVGGLIDVALRLLDERFPVGNVNDMNEANGA